MRVGAIGLGDMGSGFTQNLIANGFEVTGLEPREARLTASHDMGGTPAGIVTEFGGICDAVRVTVMNGDQAESTIPGAAMKGGGIHLLDASNSGGIPGTCAGALMMTASTGMQIILAAKSKCPQGKKFARTRVTEKIVDTELHREGMQ